MSAQVTRKIYAHLFIEHNDVLYYVDHEFKSKLCRSDFHRQQRSSLFCYNWFFNTHICCFLFTAAFSLYLSVYTSGNPSDKTASQRDCSRLWWCLAGLAAVIIVATAAFSLYLSVYTSGNPSDKTASQRDCNRLWWCWVSCGGLSCWVLGLLNRS